ncbi:MAG TPA: hypothetical protein VFS21_16615 [Roseiflexaceae bacterium]|nr:hypothetical protein [Roseiflexaceae bacterium]
MAHAPLNRLAARTLALLALLNALALPGAHPVSATPVLAPAKAAAAQEIPPADTLVPGDVTHFITANSTVFWYTQCKDGSFPSIGSINRIPVQGGESRQLYNAGDTCSPSTFRSNIVADADYLYWANDNGLMRLSTNATVGDQPQLLSAAAAGSRRLASDNDVVYTLRVSGPSPTNTYASTVQRVAKADGTTTTLTIRADKALNSDLQVSHAFSALSGASDYLYWTEDGILMRYNLNSGALDAIASDVYSFYAEGGVTSCENLRCTTTDRVYFSNGKQVSYYSNDDGTTTPVYTAWFHRATVKTDGRRLFLSESYSTTDCIRPGYWHGCFYYDVTQFIRRGREASGKTEVLYDPSANTGNLTIANGYLLWQNGGMLRRLPADAGLPHLYMPVIRR